jgi:1,5-anhydro-D-fructose reductase (1,5-anhydro-D-mannitol-forming)
VSLRIAMLSFWHVHANDYARHAATHPDVDIAAVWDEDPSRGRKWAIELGVEFHDDLADVLQRPDIDAVVVDTPTVGHRGVIVAAAEAGKHIFTEKVLAPTVTDCADILAAVGKAGVTLVVSLPRCTTPRRWPSRR